LFKRLIVPATAILAITAASAAEAKPRHSRHAQAAVSCDARGCSDNPALARSSQASDTQHIRAEKVRRNADGRQEKIRAARGGVVVCTQQGCSDNTMARAARGGDATPTQTADANGNVVGSRPSGCPRQFCGCAASLYIFGEIRPELNLASNWTRRFVRTEPSSGMVAARSGHVMVLMSHASGDEWLVHDGNSGGGRTREHVRSIRGYTIVNPRSTRTAER
jgi:hypothetical protein